MPLWRGLLKGVFLVVLLSLATIGMWYGSVHLLLGRPWMRLAGLVTVVASFRAFIWGFDLMWGRPQVWSKDPMKRAESRNPENYRHH